MTSITEPARCDAELATRLAKLADVVDFDLIRMRGKTSEDVIDYYKKSGLGYRLLHSSRGSIHMALNPSGRFGRDGYLGQARLVDATIRRHRPERVLELACGNGFNLDYLAKRHAGVAFTGIDLTPRHVVAARQLLRCATNVDVCQDDFHDLPFADQAFQLVFVIESLCHAHDLDRVLHEVWRVLKPGGVLVVVDGWRKRRESELSPLAVQAAQIIEGAMAVGGSRSLDEWLEAARRGGFGPERVIDLSEQIMPNLLRFERMAKHYLYWPPARWMLRTLLPGKLVDNVAAAYLMPVTVRGGVHTYNCVALRRGQRTAAGETAQP